MKRILAILLCIIMVLPLTVSASDLSVNVFFNAETEKVDISGSGSRGDIIITFQDIENEAAFSSENPPIDIISAFCDDDQYTTKTLLGESAFGKRILVVATDAFGSVAKTTFINPDFSAGADVADDLNKASELSEFKQIAKSNTLTLGFDTQTPVYESSSSDIYSIMFAIKPHNATAPQYYNLFYNACTLAQFKGSDKARTESLLKDNAEFLGIDFEDDYTNDERLNDNSKDELCELLSTQNFGEVLSSDETFASYFEKAKALSVINSAENWQDIKTVMEEDFSNLFTISSLSNSKSQKVYSKMMSLTYDEFDDISSNYKKALKSVENDSSSSGSSGSSGSSSSGFGGSAAVIIPSNVEIELPKDSEDAIQKGEMVKPPMGASSSFSDLSSDHWSYDAVSSLCEAKVINGYADNTFLPQNNITRAEFTKLVCTAFGIPSVGADFTDVAPDAWYNGYVGGACKYGIVNGSDGNFNPNSFITRQDAAVIVYRALKNEGIILNGGADFADSKEISLYALTAVGAFKANGILSGDGTNFYPLTSITRAEAAKLLYNVLSINY